MTATEEGPLLDQRLVELAELVRDSDSVEMKLTIPDQAQRSTLRALDVDPLQAQIRQVFFFDTPDLTLNQAGVVVRARRVQGRGDDTVVKLRPVVPNDLPKQFRMSPSFVVEVDTLPSGFVCSGSFKGKTTAVRETVAGGQRLRKLFTKDQRAFYRAHAPEGIELDALAVLGPIFVLKVTMAPQDFGGKLVGEFWLYPDGSRILELSTKCAPTEFMATWLKAREFLAGRGIEATSDQATKTKTALEFFSRELQDGAVS
jgi:hypothetical protein